VGGELGGIACTLLHGVLPAHTDVSAQGQQTDAVVCVAALEAEESLAEADGKDLHADSAELGHRVVAELVHQYQRAQHQNERQNS
jgi:hypothetical protein